MPNRRLHLVWYLALPVLFIPSGTANAAGQTLPATEVLWACGHPEESWISFCHGYVQAVFDAFHRPREYICPIDGTTRAEMAQVVYIGLKASANEEDSGALATARILAKAYPCG